MTMDDYLAARMISWPLGLYDCDLPCDGATAVIVSAPDTAPDLPPPPVRIQAVGTAIHGRPSWDQWDDLTTMSLRDAAAMMWSRTDLTPADVDVVGRLRRLFDHHPDVARGARLLRQGRGRRRSSRAATASGSAGTASSCSTPTAASSPAGRLHGYGFLHEACAQLCGEAGDRQVPGAEVAVAAAGGGPTCGTLLLTR